MPAKISALLAAACTALLTAEACSAATTQVPLSTRDAPLLIVDGLRFRDLDRNGRLDPYEDWRLPVDARARDLLARMTLAQKAGVMVHGTAPANGNPIGAGVSYDLAAARGLVSRGVVNYITRLTVEPQAFAEQNNTLQQAAEATPLGIPLTISTDPRNQFEGATAITNRAVGFSIWPDQIGFAAIGDAATTAQFADIVRQEYRAVGIQQALPPQADLATDPRWPRISGTFGEDADLAATLVAAYVTGLQGSDHGVTRNGVLGTVKHWVGYGAADDGFDSHNFYGRYARFTRDDLDMHIRPFRAAFRVKVADVMPTYSILEGVTIAGRPLEQVGAAFNHQLTTDLLRKQEGFQGVVISDFAVTDDCPAACKGAWHPGIPPTIAMPWGVEGLTMTQRFAKAINAGVDMIGGTNEIVHVVEAVDTGLVSPQRIDEAVLRILRQKFEQGLFENPFVDAVAAGKLVGNPGFQVKADAAQARSLVLLQNRHHVLPLAQGSRVFLVGFKQPPADTAGLKIVDDPAQADAIIMRADTPFEQLHPNYFIGSMMEEGSLDFPDNSPVLQTLGRLSSHKPVIMMIHLSRPAILTRVLPLTSAIVGNFGVNDAVLFGMLAGKTAPTGKLPFELPSSMAAVRAQAPDVPHDSAHPLFPMFFGLAYDKR